MSTASYCELPIGGSSFASATRLARPGAPLDAAESGAETAIWTRGGDPALEVEDPEPTATHVTHWTSDPFARGSYAFIPTGASPSDMDAVRAPVGDRVFFAGEGTRFTTASTVHGAFLSGLDAARALGVSSPSIPGYPR